MIGYVKAKQAGREFRRTMQRHGRGRVVCRFCSSEFRALRWAHLVYRHGLDREHPIEEYRKAYPNDVLESHDTKRQRVLTLSKTLESEGRRWTEARVRSEISRLRRAGESLSLVSIKRLHPALANASCRYFGSWSKALSAQGMEYESVRLRRPWSKEQVLTRIKRLARAGTRLTYREMQLHGRGLVNAAVRKFGTWWSALSAAGIDTYSVSHRRRWTRTAILSAIRTAGPMTAREVHRRDGGLWQAAQSHFGGWVAAVEAAGLRYPGR